MRLSGDLERAVMQHLWSVAEPQTVEQVRAALSNRPLAHSTVMTVLRRLAGKGLVTTNRHGRAHRYTPSQTCDEMVATSMAEALAHAGDAAERQAALVSFVHHAGAERAGELARAMREIEARHVMS